jgi:TetR/AcrR family transcriptional regulator, ethionamide resistance regulator
MAVLGRRAGTRQERRAAVEERVLGATRALLEEGEPFGDLSIDQLARGAGISRTAFYDYFEDKRELLMRLVTDAAAPILKEADELVGGRASGPTEIPFTIRAAMSFARENGPVFRATVEASAYDPVIAKFWRGQVLDRFIDAIEERIRRQRRAGKALPIAPRPAAVALVLMVTDTLYHHVTREEKTSDRQLVDTLVTIAVRAVYGTEMGEEAATSRKT